MKKVIFVSLLSLSVCLSQSSQQQAAPAVPPAAPAVPPAAPAVPPAAPVLPPAAVQNTTSTDGKTVPSTPEHPQTLPAQQQNVTGTAVVPPTTQTQNATEKANATQAVPTTNETTTKTNETKPAAKDNESDKVVPKPADDKKVEPAKEKNETKPVIPSDKANNGTNADSKDGKKNETTTPKAEVSPTAAPVEASSRSFDGPSFIGGIILTLGLLAIGFMGFKYYKNQTERNYHTL